MKPEPPETNFFLKEGLQQSLVFFTNSYSSKPELLCIEDSVFKPYSPSNQLLAHKLCVESGFQTSVETSFPSPKALDINVESLARSRLSCFQNEYYEIICNRSRTSLDVPSCSLLLVTCGPCHKHVTLEPNTSLQLQSPLYPVLQLGLVCQYDLEVEHGAAAEITIEITDLSLAPPEESESGTEHCLNSFLHVLSGKSFHELKSLTRLCGEVYSPTGPSSYKVSNSVIRLILVSGVEDKTLDKRGFLVNIQVSSSGKKFPIQRLWIFLSFLGILIALGVVTVSVLIYLNKRSKAKVMKPRRQTWHGSVTRPVEGSMHASDRRVSNWGNDNLYLFDNRVNRRLPQLPPFHFSTDYQNTQDQEDPSFKLYETISFQSLNCPSTLDGATRNTEKKFSTSEPPPLPSRPVTIEECPYSSPVYLTLPGPYTELQYCEDPPVRRVDASEELTGPAPPSERAKQGRQKLRISGLVERIRSISMTDHSEDETNLIG